jgi:PIN domain nuclease of toxin-antitoxin system
MKALLDTHAALFAWIEPDRLSEKARDIIRNPTNQLFFSQASTIEITLKHKIGKLELPELPGSYVTSRVQRFAFTYIPIEDADIFGMTALSSAHKDPFDWLLIASARRLKLPLISRDTQFENYPVKVIW